MALIVEGMRDYVTDLSPVMPQINKENTMKKTELKALVAEVVKQCVQEAGPQYKVRGKKSQLEQPGIRNKSREMQNDPEINENASLEGEDDVVSSEEHVYDEQEEIAILRQMAQLLLKLLHMHKGVDSPESSEETPEDETPEEPFFSPKSPEGENDEEEELKESNHKVQARSYKTIKDVSQNPENVRDSKVPMT